MKKNKKTNLPGRHTQKGGMAHYDEGEFFSFYPDYPVAGSIAPYRGQGTGQLLSNGTFEFVKKPRLRAQSLLIKKLPHGRVSHTKDNAIQLTLKIYLDEGLYVPIVLLQEAMEGEKAVTELLRKAESRLKAKR